MALTQPTLTTLTNIGGKDRILAEKLDVFYSAGAISSAQVPVLQSDLLALVDDSGSELFVPFGRLAEEAGSITTEPVKISIHKQEITVRDIVNMQLNSVEMTKDMLDYIESDQGKGELSFLFIPASQVKSGTVSTYILVSGIHINKAISLNVNGDISVINITAKAETDDLTDTLYFDQSLPSE